MKGLRIIKAHIWRETLTSALERASFSLRGDVLDKFRKILSSFDNELSRDLMSILLENSRISFDGKVPICQDTGYVQIYVRLGNKVVLDFDVQEETNRVVAEFYVSRKLRKSMMDSVHKTNTGNNMPAFLDFEFFLGDWVEGVVQIKGGGSENSTKLRMMLPTSSIEDVIDWVVEELVEIGSKSCPPMLIGVGIGGNSEEALSMSRRALLYRIGEFSDGILGWAEKEIIRKVNEVGVGMAGMGVGPTVLSAKILTKPCHIATMPVALSVMCNAVRQANFRIGGGSGGGEND